MTGHKVANLAAWDAAVLDARRLVTRAQACQLQQHADGFDHYNTASQNYDLVSGSVTFGSAYRRFAPPSGLPGQGIFCAGGLFSYVRKNMQSNQVTFIVKVAVQILALPGSGDPGSFLWVGDNGTTQWSAVILNNGAFGIIQGASPGTAVAATLPGVIAVGQWYGIEIEGAIAGASSSVSAWIDGVQYINASGVDLQVSGNAYGNQVGIGDPHNKFGSGLYFDDFRVWDNTGTTQNAPLGSDLQDSRLITKVPSAAGAFTQFTPNGASANWQCVDDNPPDGDTTYVSGSSTGLMDAYNMPTAGFSEAPVAVTAYAMARKDDSATRQLAIGVDSGGHAALGPTVTLGSSYAFLQTCIADDPNTSSLWTAVGADAAEFYMEELA